MHREKPQPVVTAENITQLFDSDPEFIDFYKAHVKHSGDKDMIPAKIQELHDYAFIEYQTNLTQAKELYPTLQEEFGLELGEEDQKAFAEFWREQTIKGTDIPDFKKDIEEYKDLQKREQQAKQEKDRLIAEQKAELKEPPTNVGTLIIGFIHRLRKTEPAIKRRPENEAPPADLEGLKKSKADKVQQLAANIGIQKVMLDRSAAQLKKVFEKDAKTKKGSKEILPQSLLRLDLDGLQKCYQDLAKWISIAGIAEQEVKIDDKARIQVDEKGKGNLNVDKLESQQLLVRLDQLIEAKVRTQINDVLIFFATGKRQKFEDPDRKKEPETTKSGQKKIEEQLKDYFKECNENRAAQVAMEKAAEEGSGGSPLEKQLSFCLGKDELGHWKGPDVKIFVRDCLEKALNLPEIVGEAHKVFAINQLIARLGAETIIDDNSKKLINQEIVDDKVRTPEAKAAMLEKANEEFCAEKTSPLRRLEVLNLKLIAEPGSVGTAVAEDVIVGAIVQVNKDDEQRLQDILRQFQSMKMIGRKEGGVFIKEVVLRACNNLPNDNQLRKGLLKMVDSLPGIDDAEKDRVKFRERIEAYAIGGVEMELQKELEPGKLQAAGDKFVQFYRDRRDAPKRLILGTVLNRRREELYTTTIREALQEWPVGDADVLENVLSHYLNRPQLVHMRQPQVSRYVMQIVQEEMHTHLAGEIYDAAGRAIRRFVEEEERRRAAEETKEEGEE